MSAITDVETFCRRGDAATRDGRFQRQARLTRRELGPLLAVCGLAGGAGATTVAYLVAAAAARQLNEPVLVADTGGPSGALAAVAGIEAPRSLAELAAQLAIGLQLREGIYATGPAGLRVLAGGPEFGSISPNRQLTRILDDAREAHRLTVIDCGTLARDVDRIVAAAATHLAWVMPATEHGVTQGWRVLTAAPRLAAKELLVARRDVQHPGARLKQLRRLATERGSPLVLVPHLEALEHLSTGRAHDQAQVAIQAILGAVLR